MKIEERKWGQKTVSKPHFLEICRRNHYSMLWRILKRSIFPAEILEKGLVIAFRQQYWLICWVLLKNKAETGNVLTTEEQRCLDTRMQLLDIIKKKVDNNRASRPKEESQQVKTHEVMQKEEEEEEEEKEEGAVQIPWKQIVRCPELHIMEQSNTKPRECWQCDERKYDCMAVSWGVQSCLYYYFCAECDHSACPTCAFLLKLEERDGDW